MTTYYFFNSYNTKTHQKEADSEAESIVENIRETELGGYTDDEMSFLCEIMPSIDEDDLTSDEFDQQMQDWPIRHDELLSGINKYVAKYRKIIDQQTETNIPEELDSHERYYESCDRYNNVLLFTMAYALQQHLEHFNDPNIVYYLTTI